MNKEECTKKVVALIHMIKECETIDLNVSLLGVQYNFDCNDAVLLCLKLKEIYDIDLNQFMKKADTFKVSDIVEAILEQKWDED